MASSSIDKANWLPTVDNLRNYLLTPTAEMLSFFRVLVDSRMMTSSQENDTRTT